MKKKLSNKKYLRIHPDQFRGWITEIMKEPEMRYASAKVVADEIEKRYGGKAISWLHKIRAMRIDVQNFVAEKKIN